jgi:hypothetical protein
MLKHNMTLFHKIIELKSLKIKFEMFLIWHFLNFSRCCAQSLWYLTDVERYFKHLKFSKNLEFFG